MKNFLPIWTIRMRSSSMILRKWRTENPASSAAFGISRNVLFGAPSSVDFMCPSFSGGRICTRVARSGVMKISEFGKNGDVALCPHFQYGSQFENGYTGLRPHKSLLFLRHEGIPIVRGRNKCFFDRAGADPPEQIDHGSSLVVGSAGSAAAEWLLSHDGAGRLVVDVEITRGKAKHTVRIGDGGAIGGEHCASECVWSRTVDNGKRCLPFLLGIHIQGYNRPEQLFTHRSVIRPASLNQRRADEVSRGIVGLAAGDDLRIAGSPHFVQVAGQFLERGTINHGSHEIPEVGNISHGYAVDLADQII